MFALAGSSVPTAFESISTVTVGAGGAANVEFTSIPSTYKHLQVRITSRDNRSTLVTNNIFVQINSDTGTNYSYHALLGDGSSASVTNGTNFSEMVAGSNAASGATSGVMGVSVFDILDYADTNKYKTTRTLTGVDNSGSGVIRLWSGNWRNTASTTSLKFYPSSSATIQQYSSFALYGIKGE
jgi:hypothetical protein